MSFPRTFPSREPGSHLARPQRFHSCCCCLLFQMPGGNVIQKEHAGREKYGHALLQRHKKEALTQGRWGGLSPLRAAPTQPACRLFLSISTLNFSEGCSKWISLAGVPMAKSAQKEFHSSFYRCHGEITPWGVRIRQDPAARRNTSSPGSTFCELLPYTVLCPPGIS